MTEDKLSLIHQAARAEFDQIQSAMYQERMNCLGDRRFCSLAGAQWEGPLGDQFENKPRFEVNKITWRSFGSLTNIVTTGSQ